MTDQPLLPFEPHTLTRTTDPDTSQAAAMSAKDLRARQHKLILNAIGGGAMAAEQIGDVVGLSSVQVCRRMHELVGHGLVVPTTMRHTNRSGRTAVKYRRVNHG